MLLSFTRQVLYTKAHSHLLLGDYLASKYMAHSAKRHKHAFLLGCISPDVNPTTYLKGSIRHQWLRGHNWNNSKKYITRISNRLERKENLKILDYYKLGKLIHYTTDAFTLAHNAHFPKNLQKHRLYEKDLQRHFSEYLATPKHIAPPAENGIFHIIRNYHQDYSKGPKGISTDTKYAFTVCSLIFTMLFIK